MSKFQPSVYQQGIYDFIANGQGNAVVSAVAGSGKTTTLINALTISK
jgi:superfamily I DNA/RNA helicase